MKKNKGLIVLLVMIGLGVALGLWADHEGAKESSAAREIVALKKAIAAEGLSWEAGETSMTRLSEEEKLQRLGLLLDPVPEMEAEADLPVLEALPATLDWRDHGGNWVTPIRDQGQCGSCWAFATAGVLESLVKITNNIKTDFDLSEQTLVSCSGAGNCGGGYLNKAADFVRRTGIPAESCFPYSAADEKCVPCASWMSKTVKITSYSSYSNKSIAILETALQKGPIASAMDIYSDFYDYKSGIYQRTAGSTYKGGHGVVIVGYNHTAGYWICKNSWGTGWGEDGFFRIRMGNSKIGSYCTSLSGPIYKNHPPVLKAIPAQSVDEGKILAFGLSATDSDYDTLTFSAANLPDGAALNAATGDFSWTPSFTQAGVYSIQFAVTDGTTKVSKTATITVTNLKYKKW